MRAVVCLIVATALTMGCARPLVAHAIPAATPIPPPSEAPTEPPAAEPEPFEDVPMCVTYQQMAYRDFCVVIA